MNEFAFYSELSNILITFWSFCKNGDTSKYSVYNAKIDDIMQKYIIAPAEPVDFTSLELSSYLTICYKAKDILSAMKEDARAEIIQPMLDRWRLFVTNNTSLTV